MTPQLRALPALLCVALALSACVAPTSGVPTSTPVSSNAGPGPQDATPAEAATLFRQVCVETVPSHAKARAAIATLPFVQRRSTGTYYHRSLNLSFKLITDAGTPICSLVFGATSDPTAAIKAAGNKAGVRVWIEDNAHDGYSLYHAVASAQ
jgi:hypothetical protein